MLFDGCAHNLIIDLHTRLSLSPPGRWVLFTEKESRPTCCSRVSEILQKKSGFDSRKAYGVRFSIIFERLSV